MASWFKDRKFASFKSHPHGPKTKKGAEAPPLFQSFKCLRQVKPNVAKNASKSLVRRTVAIEISGTIVRFRELT